MENRAAVHALTLYPAQTRVARWAKSLLRMALNCGVPVPLTRVNVAIAPADPLLAWLQEMSGETGLPLFAVLAGNPFASGQRFIVLVFRSGEPVVVAKLGMTPEARALVDREGRFLENFAETVSHLPRLKGVKAMASWSSLALEFLGGQSPVATDTAGMLRVLRSWLDQTVLVPLDTLSPWQRLKAHPDALSIIERVNNPEVVPAVFHGDFAPWNVRVEKASGTWTVIDWERGEAAGVPGWDWFHWMIHVSVLVHRHGTAESVAYLKATLRSADFREYAKAARIAGLEHVLLAGYLIYLHEFIVPPEIKETIAQLRDAVAAQL